MNGEPQLKKKRLAAGIGLRVRQFWDWWTGELASLVPERWRSRLEGKELSLHYTAAGFEVVESGQQLRIPLDQVGTAPTLATWRTLGKGRAGLVVTLSDEDLLQKNLSLPSATEARLDTVLGFELDRHTPFSASQASYGYRVAGRDRSAQRIDVELFVLPNALRERVVNSLAEAGLHPTAILPESVFSDGRYLSTLNLLPETQRPESKRSVLLRSRPVLIVLLLSLVIGVLFYQREERLLALQQAIGPRESVAEEAQAIRSEIELMEGGGQFIYQRKTARPATIVLLDELTRRLPDSTWLSRFELEGDELRVQGESNSASGLISLLEESPLLEKVSFTSPVTINPRSRKERFSLTAQVQGEVAQ
ncbi:PilN domain-containing protein [Marinobacterium mangrovicola]|uniref:General secretion pathway protein L n=1 Tax=Marinobacterium mangrovicola TaxID=1476959 RepID=A0A4R1GK42_9GAMM|nr:PilN domain-containing protein [Marinobacterium mangrovicola]TCK08767.1 general secretion pathway protein L [Marinobacterium mangrovicola]